jgi:hypothetical protein
VSRATCYKWIRRFREEGEAGLLDRSSRPRTCPGALGAKAERQILTARRRLKRGPHHLAAVLGRPRSTIYGVLRRHGRSRLDHTDRPTGVPIRYEKARPGELVHVDVKKLGRISPGGGHRMLGRSTETRRRKLGLGYDYIHACVDDHSRVAYVEVHPDERGETCARFVVRACEFYAEQGVKVEAVMTDNALNYRRSAAFLQAMEALGNRPRLDPRLPPAGQRQGRTVQPDHARGVGLCAAVQLELREASSPPPVGGVLQSAPTPHRGGRPTADHSAVNNVGGNYT